MCVAIYGCCHSGLDKPAPYPRLREDRLDTGKSSVLNPGFPLPDQVEDKLRGNDVISLSP
jgi:hypothetical protein